jgi:prepilin-type N-terminal cleavage/methylation domain-containing protein
VNMEDVMQDRSERGFTLIELMVSLAAFAIISLAGFAVLNTGQRSALSNDQTVQIQQNVRLAMDLIARDVRMASFGNPLSASLPPCQNAINTGDNLPGEDAGPDSIAVMTVFQQVGTLTAPFTGGNVIQVSPPGPAVNDVISLEGAFTGTVNSVGPVTLSAAVVAPTNYAANTTAVVQMKCITYTVSGATATPPYQLLRAVDGAPGVAVVDGIESLQVAYALDTNNDGIIDDQLGGAVGLAGIPDCKDFVPNDSWLNITCPLQVGAGSQSLALGNAEYAAANAMPTAIRQVRLTVVGRATPPANANVPFNTWRDPTFTGPSQVQAEDQLIASTPGIRRRALSRMVTLRNGSNL